MNFSSFVGNDEVKKRLSDYFINGRLPHCIILQGEEGTGKRTLSKLIASAAVCRSDAFSAPCNTCPSCIRAKAGSHPDIKVTVGSGASGQISTESIKNIIEDAYLRPEESAYNIYLIFAGNMLSEAAQNKLLKIIEEPPKGAMFIICIKSAESLLPTVRSRASIFTLKAPDLQVSKEFIKGEFQGLSDDLIEEAVNAYSGNIGKIKAFLSEEKNDGVNKVLTAVSDICALLNKNDEHSLLKVLHPFIKDKQKFSMLISSLEEVFRDAAVLKAGGDKLIGLDREAAVNLSKKLTSKQLLKMPSLCRKYLDYMGKNVNQALLVTNFCAELKNSVGK